MANTVETPFEVNSYQLKITLARCAVISAYTPPDAPINIYKNETRLAITIQFEAIL